MIEKADGRIIQESLFEIATFIEINESVTPQVF